MSHDETNEDLEQTPPPIESVRPLRIGDMLREGREAKNFSIKVISQHTKISVTMLEALEANLLEELPNKTYVIGYVKSVSKVLGLDLKECLNVLEKNYKELEPGPSLEEMEAMPQAEKEAAENNQALIVVFAIVAVIIIGFIYVVSNQTNEEPKVAATEEVEVQKEEPTPEPEVTEAAPEKAEDVTPQVLSAETPLKTEAPVDLTKKDPIEKEEEEKVIDEATEPKKEEFAADSEKKEDKKEEKKEDKNKINLKPIKSQLYTIVEDSDDDAKDEIPGQYRSSVINGKQNVFVKAVNGDTWLTYKEDENPIKKFVLKKGRYILIRGEEVLLFLGNLGAVKVFLNNKLLKLSSRSGVKSLVFPQENRDEHYYPLFIYKNDGTVISSKEYKAQLED